jgi:hypothetical protein
MNQEPIAVSGAPPDPRPGQMTAVMRVTAQTSGPRVLRIVLEERIIKQRTSVTVGASEKAMLPSVITDSVEAR